MVRCGPTAGVGRQRPTRMLVIGYLALLGAAGWQALHPGWLAEKPGSTQRRIRWLAIGSACILGLVPAIVLALLAESFLPAVVIVALAATGAILYLVGAAVWRSKPAARLRLAGTILVSVALGIPTVLTPLLVVVVPLVLTTDEARTDNDSLETRPLHLLRR